MDALRGAAILGMVLYHAVWDGHAFGLIGVDPAVKSGWLWFGRCVAAVFLGLSGLGLSLAQSAGVTLPVTLLRLGRIGAAAALVTAVTAWAAPEATIWFGVLHCIAVTNAIALFLRRSHMVLLLGCALLSFAAPALWAGVVAAPWAWTGLAQSEPATLDFRPVLPWLGVVLVGMAIGRTRLAARRVFGAQQATRWVLRLAGIGRHALAIYLLHQPLMIGVLILVLGIGPQRSHSDALLRDPSEAAAFLRRCRAACVENGGDDASCVATCHCVLTSAARPTDPAPARTLLPDLSAADRRVTDAIAICRKALRDVPP